ncbi:hypothetical protein HYPSUDRAFT_56780 [Hypholoma sublateritium FD-334 SS-4]|uniref:Pyridoxamine kinase/Phosphomethylpyrimidine kinase domain-containing protein n=1 Tax=Hypholoma sublateritium (strain FD-334 SS-4) TaxID=945553 RepID=A0A0D2NJK4_HYPSF|nr:hypothetical protein HYPSUDRAFT_56780 [Hypholoma sublateritium FD-334 SS-4]
MRVDGPVALTIAGSDSSGGAGIQADLKTFAAHGCYGTSVITALTAQNTVGVQGVHACPPEFVAKQITSVLDDLDVRAIKTGMLYDAETVKAVAGLLKTRFSSELSSPLPLVCDPVCVSTSGHSLLHEDAIEVLISQLFPLSTLITPNKSEAELLLSHFGDSTPIHDLEAMLSSAQKLLSLGPKAVLLKGGHHSITMPDIVRIRQKNGCPKIIKHDLPSDNMEILLVGAPNYDDIELVVDVLYQIDGSLTLFVRPWIQSTSTHGTGCTLSSAITSELAKGIPLEQAVDNATMYTYHGIQSATPMGRGYGPLNHFHRFTTILIPQPTPANPYPFTHMLIESNAKEWKEYVEHDFVRQLGKGTLDRAHFIHFVKSVLTNDILHPEMLIVFLRQDYHYLKYYARAYALMPQRLLAAKSTTFGQIDSCTKTISNVLHEIGNHKAFCATFGITEQDLETTNEAGATIAYGAYIIDIGLQGDSTRLMMALMACLLGYGEVGLWLKKQSTLPDTWVKLEDNPYRHWMEEYAGEMYQGAVRIGLDALEACAVADPPSAVRFKEWQAVWAKCTRLEKGFWDMAMELRG